MKIYTKTGDKGETGLFGGRRVQKDDLRVEAYGSVDELNAFIGLLHDKHQVDATREILQEIQRRLFSIGANLAADPEGDFKIDPDLLPADIELLENEIDKMDAVLPALRNFILPGGHETVSLCHVCRTVCRRAERLVVRLNRTTDESDLSVSYLNRLSDYFFVLARFTAHQAGISEIVWKKR